MSEKKELYFEAFGIPRPQGSKRHVGNGVMIEASNVKPWRKAIASAMMTARVATGDLNPFREPVVIRVIFYLPRPKTITRSLPSVPPDLDKLQRSVGDALSVDSDCLVDDGLVIKWIATKRYADQREPGAEIWISPASQDPDLSDPSALIQP
jgi:crossover junction endodeoxyribonuclease RusA